MRPLSLILSLALAGATLAAVPAVQSTAAGQPAPAKPSITDRMKGEAEGAVRISTQRATGEIGMVRTTGDLMPDRDGASRADAVDKATAYLRTYAGAFGARAQELRQVGVTGDRYGRTVTFEQRYQGLPVFGSRLLANLDKAGALTSVNGFAAPDLHLSTQPSRSARTASRTAVALVRLDPPTSEDGKKADTRGLKAVSPKLLVYRMGAIKGEPGKNVLAYQVVVTNGNVREMVFIDAQTGKLVNRYSMSTDALERHLYEGSGTKDNPVYTKVWDEGQSTASLTPDQLNEVKGTGNAYWFFRDTFGRDSYNAAGHSMTTVNNDPQINCPNANWNGQTTNYCTGVSSDDVVAHEWGHAYTEYTSGLIYQWQPGALNESYSDVWGETVDLINGEQDEGEGDITAKRPDGLCSSHSPALPVVVINTPADIAKVCFAGAAQFGPQVTATGVTSNVVVGIDPNDAVGPLTTDGCSALTNGAAVTGKIALIDRGNCGFAIKVKNAQNAGAIAVVIGNNVEAVAGMAGSDPTITIPSVMIKLSDRNRIVNRLATSAVNVTIKDNTTAAKTDSYRWLMGEKSTAFGGAIRDMWMPTCYGDPGKVSDAEYYCPSDDAGGVHSNSGVPNHAYALLVDGGAYNGVNTTGIGLDKAANMWFYNQTHYLTPSSGFPEMADGLMASCAALTGQPINAVQTAPNGTPLAATPITAADCQQVANVIAATQLRAEPTQCAFQPLFAQNAPGTCGPGTTQNTVWSDDFESGLGKWTPSQVVRFAGGMGDPWSITDDYAAKAPGHASKVAYGPAPDEGVCSNGAGDFSSVDSITTQAIGLPGGSAKLTFDHSISSETGVDGGNVKISVNGAPFTVIPQAAYTFNAPNATLLTSGAGNTNPMQGERAFTGTDGGKVTTKWGTSQVNLAAAGASPGDTIRLRFDIGRDGCGGLFGWFVDNVAVTTCKQSTSIAAVHQPEPSTYGDPSSVKVTVTRDGNAGSTPTGNVNLRDGAGNLVASGPLGDDGVALLALPATYPAGISTLTARYSGTDVLAPAQTPVKVTVVKSGVALKWITTTVIRKPDNLPSYGEDFTIRAKVTASGLVPTGKVVIKKDGKVIGQGMLKNGRVKITVTKNLKVGTHKLLAKYLGSSVTQPSRHTFRFRILQN